MLSAHLDKELRKKYSRRSLEVRKGDEVKIMRGKFKKKQGKIDLVSVKKAAVSIEGIQNTKKDGTKTAVWIHASKLKIISVNSDDKKRFKQRNREKKKVEARVMKQKEIKESENKNPNHSKMKGIFKVPTGNEDHSKLDGIDPAATNKNKQNKNAHKKN